MEPCDDRRNSLETHPALLRLLQADQVDVEAAATGAASQASDELRRLADLLLRIGVEAAEDERAIRALEETELLPPAQDVQRLLELLRQQGINCWSGWEYLHSNVTLGERRVVVRRLPHLASGVVVANADFERVTHFFDANLGQQPTYRFRSPVVMAPANALQDGQEILWAVVGPTSDAHFDTGAGGGTQSTARR